MTGCADVMRMRGMNMSDMSDMSHSVPPQVQSESGPRDRHSMAFQDLRVRAKADSPPLIERLQIFKQ